LKEAAMGGQPGGRKGRGRPPGGTEEKHRSERRRPADSVAGALSRAAVRPLPRGELFLGRDFLDRFFGAEGGYAGQLAAAARSLGLSLVGIDLNGGCRRHFFDSGIDCLDGYYLAGYLNGPFSRLVERHGFFNAMLSVHKDRRLFGGICERLIREVERLARSARSKGLRAVALADDIAGKGGLFFSLEYFLDVLWPVYRLAAQVLKGQGLQAFFHSDGDTRKIIEPLIEAGYACIHPVDGQAGLDIYDLRAEFGDRVAFMGHIDIMGWDEGRIGEEIERAEGSFGNGGLILGSSCGITLATAGRLKSLYPSWRSPYRL